MNSNAFIQGQKDCEKGKPQQSTNPDYIRGYGAQYALEQSQAWFTGQLMESTHND